MSDLKLSAQLVDELRAVLMAHDTAAEDPGVSSQYLCAIVGFLLGQQEMSQDQKIEIIDQLAAFMKHVVDDVQRQSQPAPPPPPPAQESFGIWKPKQG